MKIVEAEVRSLCESELIPAIQVQEKHAREEAIKAVKNKVIAVYEEEKEADEATLKQVKKVLDKLVKNEVRRLITEDKVRPDGRKVDEIRPLSSEVGLTSKNSWFRTCSHVDKPRP